MFGTKGESEFSSFWDLSLTFRGYFAVVRSLQLPRRKQKEEFSLHTVRILLKASPLFSSIVKEALDDIILKGGIQGAKNHSLHKT